MYLLVSGSAGDFSKANHFQVQRMPNRFWVAVGTLIQTLDIKKTLKTWKQKP